MSRKNKRLLFAILICMILTAITMSPVSAKETFSETAYDTVTASALDLNVSYDSNVKCGSPTIFTVNAINGSDNYKYRLGGIFRMDEGVMQNVTDPSKMPEYQENNTFSFTFYASGTYYLHFYVMDMSAEPLEYKRKIITITIDDPNYPSVEAIADNTVAECLAAGCSTDYEKALWLHDWLIDNCTYDYSYLYCGPEGALVRGTGTCEAYHRAYVMLLTRAGIETGRMVGNEHVWTAVRMDGKWYQVDPTWDDAGYIDRNVDVQHLYFGLTDDIIRLAHDEHTVHTGYESTSLNDNYFIKTGKITTWSDKFIDEIQSHISNREAEFSISVTDTMIAAYKQIIYNLVAYQLQQENWSDDEYEVELTVTYENDTLHVSASYTAVSDDTPGDTTPDTPGSTTPDTPGSTTPDTPGSTTPDTPGSTTPDTPGSTTPDTPSSTIPDTPSSTTPDTPSSTTPDTPSSTTPDDKPLTGTTIYNGVDYSAVYNYNYYVTKYADIWNAFGTNDAAVLRHFVNCGMKEGRQGCANFNVYSYAYKYVDLRRAFKNNLPQYYMHYIIHGKREGRIATGTSTMQNYATVYNGVNYDVVYDCNFYTGKYTDIKKAFGLDDTAILGHFVNCGMKEGRQGCANFNVYSYAYKYADLRRAFKNNLPQYYMHYVIHGKREGRIATGTTSIRNCTTVYNGKDYSEVYNGEYYTNKYADIRNAYGFDDTAILEHFVNCGMKEGRQGSESFNVHAYKNRYTDLQKAYGNDLKSYYTHYMIFGKKEGRICK